MNEIKYTRPRLYAKQEAAFFNQSRYSVIEGSTKSGKTFAGITWLFEKTLFLKPGQKSWWVAPVYNQAEIAFDRMRRYIQPREAFHANESKLYLDLFNDARIEFKSAEKPDNLYGEDVYNAMFDEASRSREESWHALQSTMTATEGPTRVVGNTKGRGNGHDKLSRKAQSGFPNMEYHSLICEDAANAGIISWEAINTARDQLPHAIFRELYYNEPSDDGGNPFGIKDIHQCIKPLSTNRPLWYGIDLAKSTDFTVIIGIDEYGDVCFFDRFQLDWDATTSRVLSAVGSYGARALVDSTGVGDPILERLIKQNPYIEGFKFTNQSKQMIMEGLAVSVQKKEISFPEGPIVNEMETFEYEVSRTGTVRYNAPSGLHDDCVCALALANYCRQIKKTAGHFAKESLQSKPEDRFQIPAW